MIYDLVHACLLISVRSYYLCVLCYVIMHVHGVCSRSFDAYVVPCMYICVCRN